jgi:hypothetical protein
MVIAVPPTGFSVIHILAAYIGSLKVVVITLLRATMVAFPAGLPQLVWCVLSV